MACFVPAIVSTVPFTGLQNNPSDGSMAMPSPKTPLAKVSSGTLFSGTMFPLKGAVTTVECFIAVMIFLLVFLHCFTQVLHCICVTLCNENNPITQLLQEFSNQKTNFLLFSQLFIRFFVEIEYMNRFVACNEHANCPLYKR